ncbi:MAG: DUF433 domain-containing protein [Aphanocapsa sp. GSE-SYN-MK-11-07L]|jgi:uncharacterized protein (DUF433 family)|nr:DUF433 domain-containing protein [Aphanocapsa sp. GSE-SYN-MK-11-07L]
MAKWDDHTYNTPAYSVTDAARYLHIPLVTLRSWLKGRTYTTKTGQQTFEPLIERPDPEYSQLSFTNLVEAHVLRIIREAHQVKLDKVRKALDYMSQQLNTLHPLVHRRFETDGIDLFVYQMDELVNVSRGGQLAMRETLKHLLSRVEWDEQNVAVRLFPFIQPEGDEKRILYIDPRISFGKPVIAAKGVPTTSITDLYEAGDDIEDIADEFDCTPEQVTAAIRFESPSCCN